MKIGFASSDWSSTLKDDTGGLIPGGACWYRIMLPSREMAKRGHVVEVGTLIFNSKLGEFGIRPHTSPTGDLVHGGFDVIVMQRWMHDGVDESIRIARSNGQVIVNDIDDHFFALHPKNRANKGLQDSVVSLAHYRKTLAASSLVTTSTPFLAEVVHSINADAPTTVIRNGLETESWSSQPMSSEVASVGWIGALPWRSDDLQVLRGYLGPFLSEKGLSWYHGGSTGLDESTAAELAGVYLKTEQWVEPIRPVNLYPWLFRFLDIGLVPLSDCPFNKAKSAIKGMEYLAAGIPFLASSSPEYDALEEEIGEKIVVRSPKRWRKELERMLDPAVRESQLLAGSRTIQKMGMAQRAVEWEQAFTAAMA